MEYKRLDSTDHPHLLTFDADEAEVVRAAFREHIFYLAMKGNTGSMENYEATISGWEDNGDSHALKPNKPGNVADVLEDFFDRTEEAIQSIPESTGVPAFQSDDIGERYRLGQLAMELATEIRDKAGAVEAPPLTEPTEELTDDAIRDWLDN